MTATTHVHARHVAAAMAAAVPDPEHDAAAVTNPGHGGVGPGPSLHVSLGADDGAAAAMRFAAALALELTSSAHGTPWMTEAEAVAFTARWHNVWDAQIADKGGTTGGGMVVWVEDVLVDGIDLGSVFTSSDVPPVRPVSARLDAAVAAFATAEYRRLQLARAEDLADQRAAEVPEAERAAYVAATEAEAARTGRLIAQVTARRQARYTLPLDPA